MGGGVGGGCILGDLVPVKSSATPPAALNSDPLGEQRTDFGAHLPLQL